MLMISYLSVVLLVTCISRFEVEGGDSHAVHGGAEDTEGAIEVLGTMKGEETTLDPSDETTCPETDKRDEAGISTETEGAAVYILRIEEDGRTVGVYDADGRMLRRLAVHPLAFSEADRARLSAGITVSGEEALEAILEDFGA